MRKRTFKFGVAFYMFTSLFFLGAVLATVNIVTIRTLNDFRVGLNQLARKDLSQIQLGSQLSQISATLVSYGALITTSPNAAGQHAILLQANEQLTWLESILEQLGRLENNSDDVNNITDLSHELVESLTIIIDLLANKNSLVDDQSRRLAVIDKNFIDLQTELRQRSIDDNISSTDVVNLIRRYQQLIKALVDEPIEYRIGQYQAEFKDIDAALNAKFAEACVQEGCAVRRISKEINSEKGLLFARKNIHAIDRKIAGKLNHNSILSSKILASSSRITQRLQKRIILQSDQLEKSAEEKVVYLYVLLFVSLSGFVLILLYTDRKIVQRLDMLKRNMLDLASKRSKLMPIFGNDEISEMASAFYQYFEASKKNVLELRQANEDTRKAQEKAEEAGLQKSKFLAAASHDLRQPLHAIGLLVEAAATSETFQSPQQRLALKNIQSSVTNMESLFEAILDYSQLETGHLVYEESLFPLQVIFDRIEHDFKHLAKNKSLELVVVKTKVWVNSDQNILERCIRNLVFNAINYTEVGKVLLGVRRDGSDVRVEVVDTGIGIPANMQQKLFREYYQGDAVEQDGYGLGLAIVKELVQVLGSQITITSEMSKGACFSFKLPRVKEKHLPKIAANTFGEATLATGFLTGKYILLIEDNSQIRDATESLLQSWGCVVHMASSADDAVQMFEKADQRYAAVISDYQFGDELNGMQLLQTVLGENESSSAGIVISGNTDPKIIAAVKDLGYSFLSKPVKPSKIAALLRHIIR